MSSAPSANFTANKNFDNGVSLAVTQSFFNQQESWNLHFAAPFDALLAPSLFTGATRFAFQLSSQPGLDVSGISRGHNMLDGEFVVYDVEYGADNSVTRFAASFIQREHSDTSPAPSLTGAVRFNSSIGTGGGVTANDLDIEGDLFTTVLDSGPSNGSLTLNKDGTLVYTPNTGFAGQDTFTYRSNDGRSLSNLATATITVNAINDDPVAEDDSYAVDEDTSLTVLAAGVLDNDSDFDGDSLAAVLQTGPSNGTLTLNADGSFIFTPNANFSGSDSFTYVANDGTVNSNVATVNLTIKAINDVPVADDDAYEVDEDGTLTVVASTGVLDNDSDLDGDSLSAVVQTGPSNGTLVANADGSFLYTPNAGFNGVDLFTYVATDGDSESDVATVEVTVNSGLLAVEYELTSRRINLQSNGKITITVLGNANLDGSVLNASSIRFVGVSAESWSTEDVDNDGDTDYVLKFDARKLREHLLDLYFASESNERVRTVSFVLTGTTVHDQAIEGLGMLDLFHPNEPGKKSGK